MRTKIIVAALLAISVTASFADTVKVPQTVSPKPTQPAPVVTAPVASSTAQDLNPVMPLSEAGKAPPSTTPAPTARPNTPPPVVNSYGTQPIGVVVAGSSNLSTVNPASGLPATKKKAAIELIRIADGEGIRSALIAVHGISKRVVKGDSVLTFIVGDIEKDSVCLQKNSKRKTCAKTIYFED